MPTEKFMNLGDYKKQAILDAMHTEFMTTPYSEIRISSLIKRAGISRASFYLYFESKDDLFACMMRQRRERLEQGLVEAFREKRGTFHESMELLVERIMTDESYRDCWEFCRRDAGGRDLPGGGCTDRSRVWRAQAAGKKRKGMFRGPWTGPVMGKLNEERLRCAIEMGLLVIIRISMLQLDQAADPRELKNMVYQQFAILDRGIRD